MRPEHLSLSGEQGTSSSFLPRLPEVQTGFGREMPSSASRASLLPACSPLRAPPPHSLSHTTERSRSGLSFRPLSSYSLGSLSRRKIYVNRHVDTCLNVAGARARVERGEERDREKGLEVRLLVCSVGFRGVPGRVKGEKRTPRDAVARKRVYTHTRARHARSACRPSHESKLFVTGGNRRREDICVCLQ